MQLLRLSSPVILSVLVILLNFSTFTNAFPMSLQPRDETCAADYTSCGTWCCPPSTTCSTETERGCTPVTSTTASASATVSSTAATAETSTTTSTASSTTSSAAGSSKKNEPLLSTNMIIAVATGGGIALILIIAGAWACHRKRQQGRALLAAYESPDRLPYEEISLKTKKSTSSFNSAAPPAPTPTVPVPVPVPASAPTNPGTPTSTTFSVPQHTATPPPDYKNGNIQAVDEKELFPRYPPQTFQGQDSPRTPTGSQRGPFPAEVLGSPRGSSLPPYSPARSGFADQQGSISPRQVSLQQVPVSPRQASFSHPTPLSPTQATFSQQQQQQQTAFSPRQASFSHQQPALSPTHSAGFSFTAQGSTTPVFSPPTSPMTSPGIHQEMFLPVENHQPENQGLFLPVDDHNQPTNQELFLPVDGHQPPQSPQPQHGYPMAY